MIKKKLNKLVGLKKADFDAFVKEGQIKLRPAYLIPVLKTGDEMALTSIFLSTLKLVKEFRDGIFRDIKMNRGGKAFYFTEVSFPEIDGASRIDGLVIVVVSGIIKDAVVFEMKNKNHGVDKEQIERYISICRKLGIKNVVTVSNEFVADHTLSPINIKIPKSIHLCHFSWTYILTRGQLLLIKKNDFNIKDEDQVEIMREVLTYLDNPASGVSGYSQMKPGWKELAENVKAQKPLRMSDEYIEDAVVSWHEEEKHMALLLSRKLGVLVKPSPKNKDSVKNDVRRLVKENFITGVLSIKNSVSDIKVICEFERRIVSMSVRIQPPLDKKSVGRISWMVKQLENCKKKSELVFETLSKHIWIEANIKYAREHLKVRLSDIDQLVELTRTSEIQAFHIVAIKELGVSFASNKKFIQFVEKLALDYYEGIVQHLKNWTKPAPRLEQNEHVDSISTSL